MGWLVGGLVFLGVCVIAAVVIAREAVRASMHPEPPVIVMDEVYHFIADRLSDEVAATFTPLDLREVLADATDVFGEHDLDVSPEVVRARRGDGAAHDDGAAHGDGVVLDQNVLSEELIRRAADRGELLIPEQTEPVIALLFEYFRRIGVSGIPADPA